MNSNEMWQGTVGIAYVCAGIFVIAGVAYLLYGPGAVPFFGSAMTEHATTSVPEDIKVPNLLDTAEGVLFTCTGDKALKASFASDHVDLSLSDGRAMRLPQAVSASGARYANADESFVFWNKGNTAFVQEGEEDGTVTYAECITRE